MTHPPATDPPADRCRYFGDCGGCRHQDLPYAAQLERKAAQLREWLGDLWPGPLIVVPSPRLWHYRNKVEFNFDRERYPTPPPPGTVRETVLGFKRQGRWNWTLDIAECRIAPAGAMALVEAVRGWARQQGYRSRFGRGQDGTLRYLVLRETARTAQRMVILIASEPVEAAPLVAAVPAAYPVHSLYLGLARGQGDVALAEELHLLAGAPTIDEELHLAGAAGPRQLRFRISPFAFFQTNTLATELLYGRLREWVAALAPTRLYDLYGGAGGIALSCADLVPHIVSVEEVAAATADGLVNAERNGVTNLTFLTADVRHYLRDLAAQSGGPLPAGEVVIVDPPRAGMHPKALARLAELAPEHLLYVSCNPKLFARELAALRDRYQPVAMQAFDLFPHTPHVELLTHLRRVPAP
jgi:23S rRNA (uracil1939-C5)-methyltransferase